MSAGTGILHSEKNDAWRVQGGASHDDPVRFIQMWVPPDENGIEPGYEQREIDDADLSGKLVPVASGMEQHADESAIRIRNRYAALYSSRIRSGDSVPVPDAPRSAEHTSELQEQMPKS